MVGSDAIGNEQALRTPVLLSTRHAISILLISNPPPVFLGSLTVNPLLSSSSRYQSLGFFLSWQKLMLRAGTISSLSHKLLDKKMVPDAR